MESEVGVAPGLKDLTAVLLLEYVEGTWYGNRFIGDD